MFTANDLHIIVRYCTSSFLDICWFLLTTDDLAHWFAVRYEVVSSLMQWIETTDVIPVDYSLNTPIIFCIIMWFLAIECSLVWFVECWHINDDDVEVHVPKRESVHSKLMVELQLDFFYVLRISVAPKILNRFCFGKCLRISWCPWYWMGSMYHPKTICWFVRNEEFASWIVMKVLCIQRSCTKSNFSPQVFLWIGSIGPIYWHLFTPYNSYYYTMG